MRYRHLLEQQYAYLYHGTDINSACHIIRDGKIDGSQHYEHHPVGVSLTRDYVTALEFGRYWERDFPVVFVFDQEAIRRAQTKLSPRRDTDDLEQPREREAEETIIGDLALEPYLVSINIPPAELERAAGKGGESYRSYLHGEGWDELTKRKWKAQLSLLMKHPKLNRVVPRIDTSWRARQAATYGEINEAISTSGIDQAARKTLQSHLLQFLDTEFQAFQRKHPSDRDMHDQYDAFYQYWSSDEPVNPDFVGGSITCKQAFVRRLCDQSSKCLTQVVQDHLGGDTVLIAGKVKISVKQFRVKIENREDSIDPASKTTTGGYFRPTILDPMIKVFVTPDDVFYAGMDMVQVNIVGEGNDPEHLTNLIAPTFAHEYAHMQQFIRGDFGSENDMGYIKVNGKKRGERRYGEKTSASYLHYKGSAAEIQAFASGAASELIADLSRYRNGNNVPDDADIAGVLEAIATGYADSRSIRGYTQLAWGTWKEEAESLGIPQSQLTATYQRFLKLVYRAVSDYRVKRLRQNGKNSPKENGWHIDQAPEAWKEAARTHTLAQCALIVANDIAGQLVGQNNWQDSADVVKYSESVSKGGFFLEAAYLNPEDYDSQRGIALMASFKRLVIRKMDERKEKLRLAA